MFKILNVENPESAPEIILYFWMESLGDLIYTMNRAYSHHGSSNSVLDTARDAYADQIILKDMISARDGFGFVDFDEYKKWYRWWNQWHKYQLTDEQWNELENLIKWDGTQTEETFANWRPSGSWRE